MFSRNMLFVTEFSIFLSIIEIRLETYFSSHQKEKIISLPGILKVLDLDLQVKDKENVSVSITWIKHTGKIQYSVQCAENNEYCIFTKASTSYWLFGNIPKFYEWKTTGLGLFKPSEEDSRIDTSWNDAASLCDSAGTHLPYFNSRDELFEFLQFLRQAVHMPPLEAIYIGLYYDQEQVSFLKLKIYLTCYLCCIFGSFGVSKNAPIAIMNVVIGVGVIGVGIGVGVVICDQPSWS